MVELRTSPYLNPNLDPFALGLELFAEDLPEPVAKIVRDRKKEFGDSIDTPEELRKLMQLLQQTGGDMNGLARPEFKGLEGMSSNDMLQALIDWLVNGGAEQKRSRSIGNMAPQNNYQARPTSWNGGSAPSGYFPSSSSSGPAASGGGGGGGGPAPVTPAPTEARRGPNPNGWVLPVEGQVTSRFGHRASPTTGAPDNHTGIDIAAPSGTPIQAAKDGVVKFSGSQGGYGNLVIVQHPDGTETYYAHASALHVREGQQVKAGDVIASVGSTGNSTGPHLHFEIRQNGTPVDPAPYLGL